MHRRSFLGTFAPAAALAGTATARNAPPRPVQAPAVARKTFNLPLRYHARRAERVLWNDPVPEKGLVGWQEVSGKLAISETAVVCMHTFNYGFPGPLDWSPASPFLEWNRSVPAVPKMRLIVEERIAPVVQAARSAGMRVLYLTDGMVARRYRQYRPISGRPASPTPPRSPHEAWQAEREEQMYGKGWARCRAEMRPLRGIAPPLEPASQDLIAVTTLESSTLLAQHGIWNLLFTGFDTAGCILWAPGGVLEMNQLGYRCIVLRDCTAGGEIAETAQEGLLNKAALWTMETAALAYSADSSQLLQAIAGATKG